jgi:DNA gyrase/topoisomerase IV subunit A
LGVVGPCFAGVLAKTGGWTWFLVVKLWWIAGESWDVNGQFSGSKNMLLFPDLFLRDSHFWGIWFSLILSVSENGYGKRTEIDQYRLQPRGGKGVINMKATPKGRQGLQHQPRRRHQRAHGHQLVRQDHPHRHQIRTLGRAAPPPE